MPRRDRIVDLQEPVVARDGLGSEVITWTTRATVWASFAPVGKRTERYIRGSYTTQVVRMGQFGILPPEVKFDERWRIVETEGRQQVWDVVGIGKGGHRDDWTITVKG